MSLSPDTRVMLTDALRPPAGFRVDVAVGTSYSLDPTALLLAPLSFAMFDQSASEDLDGIDPIRLLEAVRRYAKHTTVFCQAGAIHVPSNYRNILTFVEDSVLEVMAPQDGAIFHPKIWALRFVNSDGEQFHRLVVLSRNLTLDRSWDTALILDESNDANAVAVVDAGPAGEFVAKLPSLAIRPLSKRRAAEIADLAHTISRVRFAAPEPFAGGEIVPLGLDGVERWPFPDSAKRLLVISPFVTKSALDEVGKMARNRTLVSRAESLDQLGANALEGWSVNVLQRLAEVDSSDDFDDVASESPDGFLEAREGLHAKTFVVDAPGGTSSVVTGSANLTSSAWNKNVEFDVALRGPTRLCGVEAVLNGSKSSTGLLRILEDYSVSAGEGTPDPAASTSWVLERFHQRLAKSEPTLHVVSLGDDQVSVTLSCDLPSDLLGRTRIWLSSIAGGTHARDLADSVSWTISPKNVTPFVAFETTLGEGESRVTRTCVIKAALTGAVDGRRQEAVFSILHDQAAVLRYLVFLLGDPSYDAMFAELSGVDTEGFFGSDRTSLTSNDVALFEPLVRAMGRDEDALARVASLIEDLRAHPDGDQRVPEGFEELWDVVWQVHQEQRR